MECVQWAVIFLSWFSGSHREWVLMSGFRGSGSLPAAGGLEWTAASSLTSLDWLPGCLTLILLPPCLTGGCSQVPFFEVEYAKFVKGVTYLFVTQWVVPGIGV